MKRPLALPLIVSLLLAAGCVASPYDGEIVAQNPTTIIPRISGYGNDNPQTVYIYARDASGDFDEVTTAMTTSTAYTWAGTTWYPWQLDNYNLPLEYWTNKPGGCGRRATLRVKIAGYNAQSFDQPFASCWEPEYSIAELQAECGSANSPDIRIETCGALCC